MAAKGFSVFVSIGAKLLPSLNSTAGAVERRFGQMNRRMRIQAAETSLAFKEMRAAIAPLGALIAAGGLAASFKGALGHGAEFQHEITQMRIAGRTTKEVSAAINESWKTIGEASTSTLAENLKIIQETTLAFGGVQHAIENLTYNAKLGALLKSVLGEGYNETRGFNQFAKSIELLKGKVTTGEYQHIAGLLFRAIQVSGGTVNPENLLGFVQQAIPGGRAYSERYLTKVVPALIQEFGGERAGTVSSAFTRQIMGKVRMGGKGVVANWQKLGLLKPGTGKGNNLSSTGWNPKDVVGYKLALSDPDLWFAKVMVPRLKKAGIDLNDPSEVLRVAAQLFGRETGSRIASTFLDPKQMSRINADMQLYDKVLTPGPGFAKAMKGDPTMGMKALAASFKNLETSIGNASVSSGVVGFINGLAAGLNKLALFFNDHPNFAKAILLTLGGGAVIATLKVFGVALSWLMSPLTSFFRLLFSPVGKAGARVPWIVRIGKMFARLGRFLGPLLMKGLRLLGPWLLRGIAAAFGLLSNPVGWAILAVAAVALVWKFRKQIAAAWHTLVDWFKTSAWPFIKDSFSAITNWGAAIVNNIKAGISAKWSDLKGWFRTKWNELTPGFMNISAPSTPAPATVPAGGHRAMGGPVRAGHWYWVNERGQEAFIPGRSGTVIPHSEMQRRRSMRAGLGNVTFNISGVTDPEQVGRIVEQRLHRMAAAQDGYLND